MTSIEVDVEQAQGQVLAQAVRHPSGSKILGRGRLLLEKDLESLSRQGVKNVLVFKADSGEMSEQAAIAALQPYAVIGPHEARRVTPGQVDFFGSSQSCLFIDEPKLALFNRSGAAVLCSKSQFHLVPQGQRFGSLRIRPFSAPSSAVQSLQMLLAGSHCLDVRPCLSLKTAVVYSDPADPLRARNLYEAMIRVRLERLSVAPAFFECLEREQDCKELFSRLAAQGFQMILVASTLSPAVPEDPMGKALQTMNARIEHFLAPVEPGGLLLLAYVGHIPVVSAPGCFRSLKPNVLDLVLPPLLAKYPLRSTQLSALGMGGLLG